MLRTILQLMVANVILGNELIGRTTRYRINRQWEHRMNRSNTFGEFCSRYPRSKKNEPE